MSDTLDALNKYYNFIQQHKQDVFEDNEQFDMHHIQPKSLGGKDEPENVIKLRPRDHYKAHVFILNCCDKGTAERRIAAYTVSKMSKVMRYRS